MSFYQYNLHMHNYDRNFFLRRNTLILQVACVISRPALASLSKKPYIFRVGHVGTLVVSGWLTDARTYGNVGCI